MEKRKIQERNEEKEKEKENERQKTITISFVLENFGKNLNCRLSFISVQENFPKSYLSNTFHIWKEAA